VCPEVGLKSVYSTTYRDYRVVDLTNSNNFVTVNGTVEYAFCRKNDLILFYLDDNNKLDYAVYWTENGTIRHVECDANFNQLYDDFIKVIDIGVFGNTYKVDACHISDFNGWTCGDIFVEIPNRGEACNYAYRTHLWEYYLEDADSSVTEGKFRDENNTYEWYTYYDFDTDREVIEVFRVVGDDDLNQLQSNIQMQLWDVNSTIQNIQETQETLNSTLADMNEQLNSTIKELNNMNSSIQDVSNDVAGIEEQLNSTMEKIDNVTDQVASLENQIDDVNSTICNVNEDEVDLENRVSDLDKNLEDVNKRVKKLERGCWINPEANFEVDLVLLLFCLLYLTKIN